MLIRICLIVAIVAGLAVGGLNFVKVKEKITTLQDDLDDGDRGPPGIRGASITSTKKDLDKTTAELKQTKASWKRPRRRRRRRRRTWPLKPSAPTS